MTGMKKVVCPKCKKASLNMHTNILISSDGPKPCCIRVSAHIFPSIAAERRNCLQTVTKF